MDHRYGAVTKELFSQESKSKTKERTRSMGNLGRKRDWMRHSKTNVQDHGDILYLGPSKILEYGDEVKQFIVMCVREPAADGYRVLRMENVRSRRVVNDNGFSEITANLRKILHRK